MHEVDAGIGRLLDMLQRKGWLEDAWIIVTSEHGEAFLEHGTWHHRQLHEEELHIPLLIRPPGGLPEGRRVATWASLVDLVPTLLGELGLQSSPAEAAEAARLAGRTDAQSLQSAELRARLGEPIPALPLDDEAQSALRQLGYVR